MKSYKKFTIAFTFAAASFLGAFTSAYAATLSLSSNTDVLHIGDTLEAVVKIDTEGAGINAVQGTLQYPKDILQAIKLDKSDSVFDFWLQEPTYSNEAGRVTFAGGSTVGSVGKSLQVFRIVFTVKGSGRAELVLADAAVTASDGSGTNVLSTIHGLVVNSTPGTGASAGTPVSTQIPAPVQITRPALPASGLPTRPEVTIPLYPNTTEWFNRTDAFIARWKLPPDVSAVSTALDQNVNSSIDTSEGLFESKVFTAIPRDGIWYLHVRFRNNLGWGTANNYRIAVDTHPPLSFTARVEEGASTDNPTPVLKFSTKDSLSGLKDYQVSIDGGSAVLLAAEKYTGTYKLPPQAPGKHRIAIRAEDYASNSAEYDLNINITPITAPIITFVTEELFSNKQTGVAVKGTVAPNMNVLLTLHQGSTSIASVTARGDKNGNWEKQFNNQLANGSYSVSAQSQDERGALSLAVESPEVSVASEPIIQLGSIELGAGGASVLLLLLLVGGFGGGIWYWKKREGKLAMRVGFAEAEITKIFRLIADDIKKASDAIKSPTTADDEYAVKRLEENIKKMEEYVKRGIQKIKK